MASGSLKRGLETNALGVEAGAKAAAFPTIAAERIIDEIFILIFGLGIGIDRVWYRYSYSW